jgi:Fic family protein
LKDNLTQSIKMNVGTKLRLEFNSINELIKDWYEDYRDGLEECKNITYKGEQLEIMCEEIVNEKGEVIQETDFITIKENLEKQISFINNSKCKDGE